MKNCGVRGSVPDQWVRSSNPLTINFHFIPRLHRLCTLLGHSRQLPPCGNGSYNRLYIYSSRLLLNSTARKFQYISPLECLHALTAILDPEVTPCSGLTSADSIGAGWFRRTSLQVSAAWYTEPFPWHADNVTRGSGSHQPASQWPIPKAWQLSTSLPVYSQADNRDS